MLTATIEFHSGATLPIHVKWLGFGRKQRLDFYEVVRVLIENRSSLRDALTEVLDMEMDGAKSPSPYAQCISMLCEQMDAGADFDVAIRPLVPLTEAQLIRSGLRTGNLSDALAECIRALDGGTKMIGSVIGASVYPIFMLGIMYFIMGIFSKKVIPPFEKLIPPEQWDSTAAFMHSLVEVFRAAGPAIAVIAIAMIVLIIVTMPMHWGAGESIRLFLDRHVPPWSIYRMTTGTTFLKTLAAQVRASMKMDEILSEMSANASPWLRTRLDAIMEGMAAGKSLGVAMADSGYDFPDRRAVKIMKTISSSDGFEVSIAKFAERWEESTVKNVQSAAKASMIGSTLAMGILTGILFVGIQDLTDQVEQRSSQTSSRF